MNPVLKLAIVGDSGVGKSSWIKRHLTGEFSEEYRPSQEIVDFGIPFHTSHGEPMFDCRDIPGDALHTPHFDANKAMGNIDCAIVMFDLTKASTQDNVEHWYRAITSSNDTNIPIALVGSKVDLVDGNEVIESENVNCAPEGGPVKYYETSSKDPEVAAFSEPFMWLFQTLLNSEDSVEPIPNCYFPIEPDPEVTKRGQEELRKAMNSPLPDGSDDES